MPGLVNSVDSEDIRLDHGITGIANIPNQIHHEERRRSHQINIALVGDAGLGKTRFINNCLKKQIFPTGQQQSLIDTGTGVKVRIRQARLREAGVEATLNLVDVPSCSLSHDRHTW